MEIILLEKMGKLGNIGDKVSVKSGYARNFLFPTGKALPINNENLEIFEQRRAELEKAAADSKQKAEMRAAELANLTVTIVVKVGDEGKLYGSIGTRDIADNVTAAGVEINKSEVLLPEGAIRHTGEYAIDLQLHTEVRASVAVHIVSE